MNRELLDRVLSCPRLPSLPAVAVQVIEQCRQPNLNIRQIARTISNDPALAMKVLRTVNSSYYGLRQPVGTISHALVILGLNNVRTLALGFSLVGNFRHVGRDAFDINVIWRRVLYSAVGAGLVSERLGIPQREEAFLGGLLQDLGVIALIQTLGDEYIELLERAGDRHAVLRELEREALDLDHAQVGEALAVRYNLPAILAEPIGYHEQPDEAPQRIRPVVRAVALGARAADVFLREPSDGGLEAYLESADRWFGLDEAAARELLVGVGRGTREMAKLFEIDAGPARDAGDILAEANEVLLEQSLRTQRSVSNLEQRNRELLEMAAKDPLTNVANRGRFNEFLCRQFEHARRQMRPISLLLLDADHFKRINDTHGHQAGDRVLVTLARILEDHSPDSALVARYGGEEFAVIAPDTDRPEAARLAERLRRCVERTPVELDGDEPALNVTVSIGVASFDGVRFFQRPEQLVRAADQGAYAAKAAGRNCIRVFSPKAAQRPITA